MEETLDNSHLEKILQSDREFEKFQDEKKINYIMKEYIGLKNMALKDFEEKPEIFLQKIAEDGTYIFHTGKKIDFPEPVFSIYKTLKKHIEVSFKILNQKDHLIQCKPMFASIAKFPRKYPRVNNRENTVYATGFTVTPRDIDLSKVSGLTGKMILETEHKKLPGNAQLVFFDNAEPSPELTIMKLHKQPLGIRDTSSMENFSADNAKFFDLRSYYEDEDLLEARQSEYLKRNIASYVYYPVFFRNGKYLLPVGYFYMESENNEEALQCLKKFSEIDVEFNKKILKTNLKTLDVKQNVINVSEGGFLLEVTEESIVESLKFNTDFTVDLVFKKQQPLRFAARVKHISAGSVYYLGAEITGSSEGKKNMENLRSFIKLIPES